MQNIPGVDELGVAHGRAQLAAHRAERQVGVAVHGGEDQVTVDGDAAHIKAGERGMGEISGGI